MMKVRFVTANMDKERSGDHAYTQHLIKLAKPKGILFRQEVGHGLKSTRIRGVGKKVLRAPVWVVGRIGVHRGVAPAWTQIDGIPVRLFSVHGLHVRTSGKKAQDEYFGRMAKRIRRLNRLGIKWIAAGDFNRNINSVANLFDGTPHGEGIVGFITSKGLRVTGEGIDRIAMKKNWSDHPAYWIDVKAKPNRLD